MAGAVKKKAKEQPSLEELFDSLEKIVQDLEGEAVSLEDSFRLYTEGMELLKKCNETIDIVEKKVQILDEDGAAHEF